MPFEQKPKKKEYKTVESYKQKSLYLDEEDQYQAECLALLNMCGHKQAKFLGLLAHDFILKTGIDINNVDKNLFKNYMQLFEMQLTTGFNPMMQMAGYPPGMMQQPMMPQMSMISQPAPKKADKKPVQKQEEEMIKEEDMADMNNALAAFGV